ncbi:bZIP transcription factor [Rhizoctonia solani AG-3 Rhs1AP]|uniref:BZIP transcription factor n=1 Tax=Rhizoctonia solani AG-3 Rhs1AP TaxID=1086054 RepID=X8JNX6_9AGAM|nr:bZIP transcription factor [Rhizoctonia solani AG-3 Rhs1AP]
MDVASDYSARNQSESKYSDTPIGYINSEEEDDSSVEEQPNEHPAPQDSRQSDGVLNHDMQSHFQALLPMLTSISSTERASLTEHIYPTASSRDGNARFARAPSSSGVTRHRGGPPPTTSRDPPQRRDSVLTVSESSFVSTASPSVGPGDHSRHGEPSINSLSDLPYRRPGKHRIGESPTPEEYMSLPPEAKKKVDNRLSARRSRAKRKEHVHILTSQIVEQQNTIEMLRIENKQLNDHIANLSRAGYALHPPPFQPGIVPQPSPHLGHLSGPPGHGHSSGRQLPASHPQLPHLSGSPHRTRLARSPTLSHPSSSSGLVAAAGLPTGPGHVPILGHGVALASRSDASGSNYVAQGRYDSPGRGTKREVDDEVDDRLRTRVRYTSPERMNWERESQGRRMSHSSYRSPSQSAEYRSRYHSKQAGPSSRSPSPQPRWEHLPPSLAAARQDTAEDVSDYRIPIQISGQGLFSDRLATLIRVHKRAILTYQGSRRSQMTEREEERMEGVMVAAEAIGKEVEELTEEFHYVGRHDGD